jgi:hypothetical protein
MCEHESAKVMIAKDAKPLLACQTWSIVHPLIHMCPLATRIVNGVWRRTTLHQHATPIEVVPNVENIIWFAKQASILHLPCHILLCTVIGTNHEGPMVRWHVLRPTVCGLDGLICTIENSTPITDHKNMVWALSLETGVWQGHAIKARRNFWRFLRKSEPV